MISRVVYGSEKELCWLRSVEQSGYDELSMTESSLITDLRSLTDSNASKFWPMMGPGLRISLWILLTSLALDL